MFHIGYKNGVKTEASKLMFIRIEVKAVRIIKKHVLFLNIDKPDSNNGAVLVLNSMGGRCYL